MTFPWGIDPRSYDFIKELVYSVILKSIGLSCTLNGSFIQAWFCNIMPWSLKNTGLLSHKDLWNVDTFYYIVSNDHNNITTGLIRKALISIGKQNQVFAKIQIFTWKLLLSLGKKYSHLFSLEWQLTSFIFEKMSAKHPAFVWLSATQVKMFHEKSS